MGETMLVTGGCGFIGSCFVLQQMQQYPDIRLINFDKLTYAGNPDNVREVADNPRYTFVQADVADRPEHDRRYALSDGSLRSLEQGRTWTRTLGSATLRSAVGSCLESWQYSAVSVAKEESAH